VGVRGRPEREGATAVWTHTQPAAQGPLQLTWNGRDTAGAAQPTGRYVAAITLLDPAGRPQHSLELPFVHEDTAARDARYGQVTGQLQAEGAQAAANAEVELVDASGRVVQRTMSNEAGNWRFRDVDQGQYRVRVRRAGFRAAEMPVSAAPARASSVGTTQLQLH
jgi:squalene-hopene/tetraprenyl-beta-curcumene cyclase